MLVNTLSVLFVYRQSLIAGPGQTNYNTLERLPENVVAEEPVQPIREPDEYPGVQGTLGSIMMFLMRQSYIAALIIMMVKLCYIEFETQNLQSLKLG